MVSLVSELKKENMSIFGPDPEVKRFLNELIDAVNQLNKKLTDINDNVSSISTKLYANNEMMKDLTKEICEGQVHVSYEFAYKNIYEKSNKKRKIDLISKMYLDEIIEIKTNEIQSQIHSLKSIVESIDDKIKYS